MKTTITLFVQPESIVIFLEVLNILENLPLQNNYTFNPKDLIFKQEMISNWIWLNIPIDQYLKLKYKISSLS